MWSLRTLTCQQTVRSQHLASFLQTVLRSQTIKLSENKLPVLSIGCQLSLACLSAAGEGVQHPSAHDRHNCGQKLTGTICIPFIELQLADGELVVFEEIGWATLPARLPHEICCATGGPQCTDSIA
jgi:hypothetical protein